MNKRIRKKKQLKEFSQFGFELSLSFSKELSEEKFHAFIDDFIEEAIENNNLEFGGGGSQRDWSGVIAKNHRYFSTTKEDKKHISTWLKTRKEVIDFSLSEEIDLWNGL